MTTMKLRAPGENPVLVPEPELKPGYGMCDTTGHHGYCWIVEPREILNKTLHGKCGTCKRRETEDAGA